MAQFLPVMPVAMNALPGLKNSTPDIAFDQRKLYLNQQVSFLLPQLAQAAQDLQENSLEGVATLLPVSIPVTFAGNSLPVESASARLDLAVRQQLGDADRLVLRSGSPETALSPGVPGGDALEVEFNIERPSSARASAIVHTALQDGLAKAVTNELGPERLATVSVEHAESRSQQPSAPVLLTREGQLPINVPALLSQSAVVHGNPEAGQPVVVQVGPPVHHPDWNNAMVARVVWQIGAQVQQAQFQIHPPELGPVEVRVSVNNDQASVQFIAQHGFVRDALEDSIPRLRELLSHGGLTLANADVSDHGAANRQDRPTERFHSEFTGHPSQGSDPSKDPISLSGAVWLVPAGRIDVYA